MTKYKQANADSYLKSLGIDVVRYTNLDIKNNFVGVSEDIMRRLDTKK